MPLLYFLYIRFALILALHEDVIVTMWYVFIIVVDTVNTDVDRVNKDG